MTSLDRFREMIMGSDRGFGLLLLPMFLMAALIGATLTGALAILYYGQQVSRLEAQTSDARAQVLEAREEVLEAAEEARRAIEAQVEEVRTSLADDPPIEGPHEAGVYAVQASHPLGERRVGSGFTLFSSGAETIVVTTYRLVATDDGFAVPNVEVLLPDGNVTARVHNYDRSLDVATLVLSGKTIPVAEWRPASEDLTRGDRLYLAGIAGPGAAAVLQGTVGTVAPQAVVPSIPVNSFLAGGPLLDAVGRVVAIASLNYAPFGQAEAAAQLAYGVPIRALCRELIQCADADQGAEQLRGEGGRGAVPTPPRPPQPPPEPAPEPEPEPEPEPPPEETPPALEPQPTAPPPQGTQPPPPATTLPPPND